MTKREKIDYRYLNLDSSLFCETQVKLTMQLNVGAQLMAIPNFKHNQVLIVGANKGFSAEKAIRMCKKLSKNANKN